MELVLRRSTLRPWRDSDAESLAQHANDREIWRNLRDAFPHPYGLADARAWLAAQAASPATFLAIEVDGRAVGGVGIGTLADVYRHTGELGYWLGRAYWRRGIMSEAVAALSAQAFEHMGLARLQCGIFAWNEGSRRVLERCGYRHEGVQRNGAFKDGRFVDVLLYARLRDDD